MKKKEEKRKNNKRGNNNKKQAEKTKIGGIKKGKEGKGKRKRKEEGIKVYIFSDGVPHYEINKIITCAKFTLEELGIDANIEYKGDIWEIEGAKQEKIFEKLVKIRVIRWDRFELHEFVSPTEISFERRKAEGKIKSWGIIYDGFALSGIFRRIISPKDDNLNIVITDRQIGTLGEDGRYHLRIAVLGNPSVISKHGFFSAPAKPREYHLTKLVSEDLAILKGEELKEKIEKSIPMLARAYILESILWWYEGVEFCSNKKCFLSDSHTTDELLSSKKSSAKLCKIHKKIIAEMRGIRRKE